MFLSVITAYLLIIAKGDIENLSNYTNAKLSCHNRGGLFSQKLLKFDGLINITCDLGVNDGVFKDGESVWVQGKALTGPYIALHTCMRFSSQDKHSFARSRTFQSNILYECSVFCDQILHSNGYLGIYKDSCFCMYYSFRFPYTPECLEIDFMDIHNGIFIFKLNGNMDFDVQSQSASFNCLGASFNEGGKTSYFRTKCSSTLYGICTQRVDSYLSNKCLPRARIGEFCFNEEKSTFLEHYRNCWLYNGTLIPFNSGTTDYFNYSVMVGSFRPFKVIEDDGENMDNVPWSCLSMTLFNKTNYLETENCSIENAFICMDDLQEATNPERSETTYGETILIVLINVLVVFVIASGVVLTALRLLKGKKNALMDLQKLRRQMERKLH